MVRFGRDVEASGIAGERRIDQDSLAVPVSDRATVCPQRAGQAPAAEPAAVVRAACIYGGLRVDWCPSECLTIDRFRLTPAEPRESVDLAIVADG